MALALLTIGTVNHIPGIRVVLDTFAEHHPDARLFTCLVDAEASRSEDTALPGVVFAASDILLPGGARFLFKFDAFELCCALKPFAARYVLERYGVDRLVYLDSDVMVFGPLGESFEKGWTAGRILCTPHFVEWPNDPPEILRQIRQCGTYNAGFFALEDSAETRHFLSWWEGLCAEMGIYDPATGRFVDQIWLDLVVAERYGFAVLMDPGLNVGYWNIAERALWRQGSTWMVDRHRLGFFHFSGFDEKQLTVRRKVTFSEVHLAIAAEYHTRLQAAGLEKLSNLPYGYATYNDGFPISRAQRRAIFRNDSAVHGIEEPFKIRGHSHEWETLIRASGEQPNDLTPARRALKRLRDRAVQAWRRVYQSS